MSAQEKNQIITPRDHFGEAAIELRLKQMPYMGIVEIKGIWDEPGHPNHGKLMSYVNSNVITLSARTVLAMALAGKDSVHSVAWGGGTAAPQRSDPQPSWPGLLQIPLVTSPIDPAVSFPTVDSVIFSSSLPPGTDPSTGYNLMLSEVGLVSANGLLAARFTFPAQNKFEQLRLSVNWQIIIV